MELHGSRIASREPYVETMDNKMQTTQLVQGQFRSRSAETAQEIRPKPKLAAVHPTETETTPKLRLLPVSVSAVDLSSARWRVIATERKESSVYTKKTKMKRVRIKSWTLRGSSIPSVYSRNREAGV